MFHWSCRNEDEEFAFCCVLFCFDIMYYCSSADLWDIKAHQKCFVL